MIKYLGSKRRLIPDLVGIIESLDGARTVLDLFAGTSRVGHALKARGYRVHSNDVAHYAHTLASCLVATDREEVEGELPRLLAHLNSLPGRRGYFTRTFCEESRFLRPENGARVDAIRAEIDEVAPDGPMRSTLLSALILAADRVDSTTGVQMAYLKGWAERSSRRLELLPPPLLPAVPGGRCSATCLDAFEAVEHHEADVAYLDPPYNHHSYLGNYHVWETLALGDEPEVYGVACKRVDVRTRKSVFNAKPAAAEAFGRLVDRVRARDLVVSFSDEGFIGREQMEALLARRGTVHTVTFDAPRYIGARIGIHGPSGKPVGKVGRLRNSEFVYVVRGGGRPWEPPQALASAIQVATPIG